LNGYLEQCLDIICLLDSFRISHISREDNWRANKLAQQASGYEVKRGLFMVKEKPVVALLDVANGKSVEAVDKVGSATEVGPTEIPCEGKVLATSKGMIKPIAQPRMEYMSISKGDETIRPMGQGDPAGALAVGKSSNEDNQSEPIAQGSERTCDQSRELAEGHEDVDADWRQPLLGYLRALDCTVD
jgi:hypothetical protein